MNTFERRYTDPQRRLVYELKLDGRSGREISELCAEGLGDELPFEISVATANRIAREERDYQRGRPSELAQTAPAAALDRLAVRMIGLLEDWVAHQKPRSLDTAEFARVTRTLDKLHSIAGSIKPTKAGASSNGNGHHDTEPRFLERIASEA